LGFDPEERSISHPLLVTFFDVCIVEFEFDVVGIFSEFVILELLTGFYEVLIFVRPVEFNFFSVIRDSVFFLVSCSALRYEVTIFVVPLEEPIKILIYCCLCAFSDLCFLGFCLRF